MKFNRENLKSKIMNGYIEEDELDIHETMDHHSGSYLKIIVPVMMLVVAGCIGYAWYTDKFALKTSQSNLPVIHADSSSVREKPQDPGGMVIEGRDKMIYDHISATHKNDKESDTKEVMRVMPQTEEPMNRGDLATDGAPAAEVPDAVAGGSAKAVKKLDIADVPADTDASDEEPVPEQNTHMPEPAPAPETASAAPVVPSSPASPSTVPESKAEVVVPPKALNIESTQPIRAVETKQKIASENIQKKKVTAGDIKKSPLPSRSGEVLTLPDPAKKHGYYIQLGSFREADDVKNYWQKIQKHYTHLLKKLSYLSEKADLGEQGIFYRLQVGPFKNEREARKLCQDLIELKQRCFFVK